MWQRFVRALRALFGSAVSAVEDPERILEQNIRDLNDQVPKMNESIAMVKANVTLLERENTQYRNELAEVTARVKAAIAANRDDIAGPYALQLQSKRTALTRNEQQMVAARAAYDKAVQVKQAFLREKERKTRDATEALRDARRAKWQAQVADTMESFQVAGIDATHDEMLRKVQEKTALGEARLDMALEKVDTSGMKIEEEAEKLRAQQLLAEFKLELTAGTPPTVVDAEVVEPALVPRRDNR